MPDLTYLDWPFFDDDHRAAPAGAAHVRRLPGAEEPPPRCAGGGFKIAMATLDMFRPTVGAAALGFVRRGLDKARERAGERRLLGVPMGELQMVQAKLADMALGVDASALLVYRAAAMAKLHASETAQRVIDDAAQIFGVMGVVSGYPVEPLHREIRALRIYEGASEVQKVIIARQVLAARRRERRCGDGAGRKSGIGTRRQRGRGTCKDTARTSTRSSTIICRRAGHGPSSPSTCRSYSTRSA